MFWTSACRPGVTISTFSSACSSLMMVSRPGRTAPLSSHTTLGSSSSGSIVSRLACRELFSHCFMERLTRPFSLSRSITLTLTSMSGLTTELVTVTASQDSSVLWTSPVNPILAPFLSFSTTNAPKSVTDCTTPSMTSPTLISSISLLLMKAISEKIRRPDDTSASTTLVTLFDPSMALSFSDASGAPFLGSWLWSINEKGRKPYMLWHFTLKPLLL
mmetsp:Transcript_12299/g.34547  ORF Transcript_12299/g.34547 Transcript_12299/m.34547 type:complete len:217 (+) Transcript_12299:309-959(+)